MVRAFAGAVHIGPELAVAVDSSIAAVRVAIVVSLAGVSEVGSVEALGDQSVSAKGVTPAAGTPGGAAVMAEDPGFRRHGAAEQEQTQDESKCPTHERLLYSLNLRVPMIRRGGLRVGTSD